jgi:hypothetical protein
MACLPLVLLRRVALGFLSYRYIADVLLVEYLAHGRPERLKGLLLGFRVDA